MDQHADAAPPPKRAIPPHVPADRVFDIDVYGMPGAEQDYQLALQAIHARGLPDVVWTPRYGGHWILTRHADIVRAFSDYDNFSSRSLTVPYEPDRLISLMPINADLPEHSAYRSLLATAFLPRQVNELSAKARAIAIGLIEGLRPRGGCEFVSEFAQHLPIAVFMSIVDVPPQDRDRLLAWADGMVRPDKRDDVHATIAEIFSYVGELCVRRRSAPGTDLLSRIIAGRVFGRPLTEQEIVGMCTLVLIGGMDTVVSAMSFAAHFLAKNPAHRRQLIADPGLIPNAADELLRRFAIVNGGRLVIRPVTIDGVTLQPGDPVMLPTVLGGLDERVFPAPLEVEFSRPNATDYATFGRGPHRCPGANLGRSELRVFLEEWLARIPDFEVAPGGTVGMSSGVNGTIYALPLIWPAAGPSA